MLCSQINLLVYFIFINIMAVQAELKRYHFVFNRVAAFFIHPSVPNPLPTISNATYPKNCFTPGIFIFFLFLFQAVFHANLFLILRCIAVIPITCRYYQSFLSRAGMATPRASTWFSFSLFTVICFCHAPWTEPPR
jgi:hypothetical protein